MRRTIVSVMALMCAVSTAEAGPPAPNLEVEIFPPSSTPYVYQTARYQVRVRNIGNKDAAGVQLTIQLPKTSTSPQVYIMGTLGAKDSRCVAGGANGTLNGTKLICTLGPIPKNGGFTTPYFDIAIPESSLVHSITATATTTTPGEVNSSNNTDTQVADLLYYAPPINPDRDSIIRHCTGTGLSAFFECTKFPSSITSHPTRFHADGSLSIDGEPAYTGRWSQPGGPETLEFRYYLTTNCSTTGCVNPEAEFSGRGAQNTTTTKCFEGLTRFPDINGPGGYSTYVSPYEVCLQ